MKQLGFNCPYLLEIIYFFNMSNIKPSKPQVLRILGVEI
ncbi:hypothetical protein LEP1GSC172_1629 [Leptospira noguchii]|uniref:Uncharacterized protein n=1 Tax=Leptospira noguchii TaxID=28182 RepID=M6VS28_9LEPT|nr:hypothetical protein LEP1GSC172_1629 [Leptospira noguchii]